MSVEEKWESETEADWIVTPSKVKLKPIKPKTEEVEKGNPYRDSKTGRFTFAPGGRASERDSRGFLLSEEQRRYFAESQAVDEWGRLKVLHHGTVHDFTEFDTSLGTPSNNMGQGIYLTDNENDANINYGNTNGADLLLKIEHYTDMLIEQGTNPNEARRQADELFITSKPKVLDCYVDIKKPVVLGGKGQTFFNYDNRNGESGELHKLAEIAGNVTNNSKEYKLKYGSTKDFVEQIKANLSEYTKNEKGRVRASVAVEAIKDACRAYGVHKKDKYGDMRFAPGEVARKTLESMGYDGIIDKTAGVKFQRMNGVTKDTTHYIVFNSNQVKLIGNDEPTNSNDITKGGLFSWGMI